MFRRLLLALVAVVALITASAVPAAASCGYTTGIRFWDYHLCMAIGDTTIEAPQMAQQWNLKGGMAIQAANNCVTAGYPPSRRFTIETYYSSGSECWKVTGPNGAQPGLTAHGSWWWYTDNPMIWVDLGCMGSNLNVRRHIVSAAIGSLLGLHSMNSSGMNSRVMNMTAWSQLNVPTADIYSGALMEDVYNGDCGG